MKSCFGVCAIVAMVAVASCAYPRRTMSVSPLPAAADPGSPPANVHRLRMLSAIVPPRQRGDLPWDEDGSGPDVVVRVFVGGERVWQSSPPVENTVQPAIDQELPRNIEVDPSKELRLELWDQDAGSGDVIGIWRGRGLPPNALPGAEARIMLEGGATLVFRVDAPRAHVGLGVEQYEVHDDALKVLGVLPHSPAARAGVREGDRIVAIDGRTVEDLGESGSASALSMAGTRRGAKLTLDRGGRQETVELDGGYVWLVM